jgi:putative ABC transport system permease protein
MSFLILAQTCLKIAFRTVLKNKLFSVIKITGLSLGVSAFSLLTVLVKDELQYDKNIKDCDRIFRIIAVSENGKQNSYLSKTPFKLKEYLDSLNFREIEESLRIFDYQLPVVPITIDKKIYHERQLLFADTNFFNFFNFNLSAQESNVLFPDSNSVIITENLAEKYFGSAENTLGKEILYQHGVKLKVSGTFSRVQPLSHLKPEIISTFQTIRQYPVMQRLSNLNWNSCHTYIKLKPDTDIEKATLLINKRLNENGKIFQFDRIELQNITKIHLTPDYQDELTPSSHSKYVIILAFIGIFIALISAVNITNLTTAETTIRAKEVSVRKILGSNSLEIFFQVLSESIIVSLPAIFLSFVLLETFYNEISAVFKGFMVVPTIKELIIPVFLSGLLFGLLSGIYPAFSASKFDPADVLHGKMSKTIKTKWLRKALIVIQIMITTMLLTVTMVNVWQVAFLRSQNSGFDTKNVFLIPIQHTQFFLHYDSLKFEILNDTNVSYVSSMECIIGKEHVLRMYRRGDTKKSEFFNSIKVLPDFPQAIGLKLLAGRFFEENHHLNENNFQASQDDTAAVIVNREMIKFLGFKDPSEAIGFELNSLDGNEKIVGVVENFHIHSLHQPMQPFVIDLPHGTRDRYLASKYLVFSVRKPDTTSFNRIEAMWKKLLPDLPYEFFSLKSKLEDLYLKEMKLAQISFLFTELAILISCIGLFGMSSFITERRRQEISIRKAIGAGFWEIYILFLLYFIPLVLSGIILGNISASIINFFWLETYAYHVSFHLIPYFISSVIVIFITILVISYHAFRSALSNPSEDLNKA